MTRQAKIITCILILILGGIVGYFGYQLGQKQHGIFGGSEVDTPTGSANLVSDVSPGPDEVNENKDTTSNQTTVTPSISDTNHSDNTEDNASSLTGANSSTDLDADESSNQTGSTTTDASMVRLGFAGDVNFDEASKPMAYLKDRNNDLSACFSKDLFSLMQDVDIFLLNNEFCYSTRGTKTAGKSYTFRANPSRAKLLLEMGVDIVSLANNHALDYGSDALVDTFTTLEDIDMPYIGAGKDLDRAMEPVYITKNGMTIGYVSGSRVVYDVSWYATASRPGMLATYDPANLIASIKEAKANSDYVVVYVHWGIEREEYPVDYQRTLAKQYIDAGADAVIGAHPHVIQGIEYYNGKPIVYSLGNYWFSSYGVRSAFAEITLDNGEAILKMYPVYSEHCYTKILDNEKDVKDYYSYLESISFDVAISEDGIVTEKQ